MAASPLSSGQWGGGWVRVDEIRVVDQVKLGLGAPHPVTPTAHSARTARRGMGNSRWSMRVHGLVFQRTTAAVYLGRRPLIFLQPLRAKCRVTWRRRRRRRRCCWQSRRLAPAMIAASQQEGPKAPTTQAATFTTGTGAQALHLRSAKRLASKRHGACCAIQHTALLAHRHRPFPHLLGSPLHSVSLYAGPLCSCQPIEVRADAHDVELRSRMPDYASGFGALPLGALDLPRPHPCPSPSPTPAPAHAPAAAPTSPGTAGAAPATVSRRRCGAT